MDLFDPRSGEALFVADLGEAARARRRGEEAVAARFVADAGDLGVELGAGGLADARDFAAEEGDVEGREYGHEAEVLEGAEGRGFAKAKGADRELEAEGVGYG